MFFKSESEVECPRNKNLETSLASQHEDDLLALIEAGDSVLFLSPIYCYAVLNIDYSEKLHPVMNESREKPTTLRGY